MRTFDDTQGRHWQAAVMEGSFGSVLLIFGQIGGDDVLHSPLDAAAANLGEAEQLVARLGDAELQALLATATPWNAGG